MSAYNLPDTVLLHDKSKRFMVWIPDRVIVVLGASNNAEDALHTHAITADNIVVTKRPSGGQSVVLTPNNLIVSVAFHTLEKIQPKAIFIQINSLIIKSLQKAGVDNLAMRGISDIAIEGKKILGSSIYRSKDTLFYHAVLNVSESAATFEKYLKHPTLEPDYRQGRTHSEFVTSLHESGCVASIEYLQQEIVQQLQMAEM